MNILFRVDATVQIGTGHAMRCLALAQACVDSGGQAFFAMASTTAAIEQRIKSEHLDIVHLTTAELHADVAETVDAARNCSADWIVLDGYQFGSGYHDKVRCSGIKLLVLDDLAKCDHYSADLVLNQNPQAAQALYPDRFAGELLLGSRFALLRREFKRWRGWSRNIPARGRRVLISMGGSDPACLTEEVISAVASMRQSELEVLVVLGGSNPNAAAIERSAAELAANVRVFVDPKDMGELIAWADVAISAAGSTCYEFCLLGLPAIVVDVADNQTPIALELSRRGVAHHIGSKDHVSPAIISAALEQLLASPDKRANMARVGQQLVDGHGAERVLAAMRSACLRLQPATEADCELVWKLANEPGARANSFCSADIPWEEHSRWFADNLKNPNCRMFLARNGQTSPVGLIRYLLEGSRATVSLNIAHQFRGQGYGRRLLQCGTKEMFNREPIRAIDAYVKPDNQASLKLFTGEGFERVDAASGDRPRIHLVLQKSGSCHD